MSRLRDVALSLYGSSTLLGMALLVPQTLVPALGEERLGLNKAQIGMAMGFVGIGRVVSNVPAASSQRRLGDKATMVVGVVIFAVAGTAVALVRSLAGVCVGLALIGTYQALHQLGRQSWSRVMFKNEIRGRALGAIGGVTRVASVFGPIAAGLVAARANPRLALLMTPLFAVLALILLAWLPVEPSRRTATPDLAAAYRTVLAVHGRALATSAFFGLLMFWLRSARQLLLPLAAVRLRLDADVVGAVVAASFAVDAFVGIAYAGRVMDGMGRKAAASMACVGFALGFLALAAATSSAGIALAGGGVALAGAVLGVGNGFSSGLVMTISTDLAPEDNRGAFLSLFRLAADAGSILGPDVSGLVSQQVSLFVACLSQAGLAVLCLAFVVLVLPESLKPSTHDSIEVVEDRKPRAFFPPANRPDSSRPPSLLGAAATLTRTPLSAGLPLSHSTTAPADPPTYSIIDDDDDEDDDRRRADDEHPADGNNGASDQPEHQTSDGDGCDEENVVEL